MLLKPDIQVDKITDITIDILNHNHIKAILLDSDNTLIDLDRKPLNGIKKWIDEMKKNGIKFCILSNSIKKNKVAKVAKMLDIPYVYFSIKPRKIGFKKARKILKIEENENIAEVGDQLFTDVLGTKRMKMFSILTKPISKEKFKINCLKRKLEKKILERIKLK